MSLPGRPKGEYRSAKHGGFLMSLPGRPKGEYRRLHGSAFAFALALALAVLMVGMGELGYREARTQMNRLVLLGQSRLELAVMLRRVADAESGHRGYLLTSSTDYLTPYRDANQSLQASVSKLNEQFLRLEDAEGRQRLKRLQDELDTKLSEMTEVMALHDAGRRQAALELVQSGIGRERMDNIRAITFELIAREEARMGIGVASVFDTLLLNRVGVTGMTALSLLVLGMYLRQRRLSDEQRAQQQREIQDQRDRLELEVRHRTLELTDLARHLETTREDEKARLARDLHDELGALLTAAKLDVARMRPLLLQAAPDLLPRIAHLGSTLNSGIALKRRIIEDLRPSTLSTLGLLPALQILCAEFAERLGVSVQTDLHVVTLTPAAELTAFRLVQESLSNIAKHASARAVWVTLVEEPRHMLITVRDDGVGFDPAHVGAGHHGLLGMRYRVQAEEGQLAVQSARGQGTLISARVPLQATQEPGPGPEQHTTPPDAT